MYYKTDVRQLPIEPITEDTMVVIEAERGLRVIMNLFRPKIKAFEALLIDHFLPLDALYNPP